MNKLLAVALVWLCAACSGVVESAPPAPVPGQQGAECGFDKAVECDYAAGLECFGTCTFVCESAASADRCAQLGGQCEAFAPGVQISICKLPKE